MTQIPLIRTHFSILRRLLPMVVLAACVWLLWQRIAVMDMGQIITAINSVTWAQWTGAALATWISFQAVGQYDALWHDVLQTGVPPKTARRAGAYAIAIAQTVGFGSVTGSMVRWRCLPALSLWQATQVSFAVTLSFAACWTVFATLALLWLGGGVGYGYIFAVGLPLVFVAVGAYVVRSRFAPTFRASHLWSVAQWTAIDMSFAAVALFLLLPPGTGVGFSAVLAAYVVALGVGLISNAPGGAGAFELTLIALLHDIASEPLIAGILAFRIVYYLIPAVIALIAIARPTIPTRIRSLDQSDCGDFLDRSAPAAWGIARQGARIRSAMGHYWLMADAPATCASVGPPLPSYDLAGDLRRLRSFARSQCSIAALYNCDARTATVARGQDWHVRRVAMEATIRTGQWSTHGSARQQLRRKLKQAAKHGITVSVAEGQTPMAKLHAISDAWAKVHGGEFGFSMGYFCPHYVQHQRVFLIHHNSALVGFVTFHAGPYDWSLDLIRHVENIPDGAIQSAIVTAIQTAKAQGITKISLATVPDPRFTPRFWAGRRAGLTQFKRSFGPHWEARYHAAPSRIGFWVTACAIGLAVQRPFSNLRCRIGWQSPKFPRFGIDITRHS